MKIIILKKNILNTASLENGISQAVALCKNIGLNIEVTYKDVSDKTFDTQPITTDVVAHGYAMIPAQILACVDGLQDIACLVFNWDKVAPYDYSSSKPINPCSFNLKKGNEISMEIPEQWYGSPVSYPEVLTQFFLHELCHCFYYLTNQAQNDRTHFQYSNAVYSNKPANDYYLYLIAGLLPAWNQIKNITPVNLTPTLKKGDNNIEAIKLLQTKINLFPYIQSNLLVDGDFGTKTQNALKAFQSYCHLLADGVCGKMTWQAFDMIDIITKICHQNGIDPLVGIAVAICESNLNPKNTLFNPPSNSIDRGLFQWNSKYHAEISDVQAFDPTSATQFFCKALKENPANLHNFWSASEPNWKKKLTPALLTQYHIV